MIWLFLVILALQVWLIVYTLLEARRVRETRVTLDTSSLDKAVASLHSLHDRHRERLEVIERMTAETRTAPEWESL